MTGIGWTSARQRMIMAAAAALLVGGSASAAPRTWDHVANIKTAAVHLSELQKTRGALGAFEFIAACYQTHELAEDFGAPLEACLVQDYIHSKLTAAIYAKLPAAERTRMGAPSPEEMVASMLRRFGGTFARYKLKEADARKLIADIDKHGIPEFTKARFPKKAE